MVYLLDDSGSLSLYQNALYSAFRDMVTVHQTKTNVRVAVIKHTNPLCHYNHPLSAADLDHVTTLFDFKQPKNVQVSDVKNGMLFRGCIELLYPGIEEAMKLIQQECPTPTLTPTAWCKRKVIMALGDGTPGASPKRYYNAANPGEDYPTLLLKDVVAAGIVVNTACVGGVCGHTVYKCKGYDDPRFYSTDWECAFRPHWVERKVDGGATGGVIMKEIASRTRGRHHQIR